MRPIVAFLAIAFAFFACVPTGKELATAGKGALVDCTTATATKAITEFGPAVAAGIADARDTVGNINWQSVQKSAASLAVDSGACVLADLLARAASGARPLSGPTIAPEDARRGFAQVRDKLWPGVTFKTSAGAL